MISINYQRKESSHSRAAFRLVSWQFTVVSIRTELMWIIREPFLFNEILLIPYQRPLYISLETHYYFRGDLLLPYQRPLTNFIADPFLPHYRPLTIFTYWRPHFISLETPRVLIWYSFLTCQKLLTSFEAQLLCRYFVKKVLTLFILGATSPPLFFCDNWNSILAR